MSPSMLNTLSVTITRAPERVARVRAEHSSRKSISRCGKIILLRAGESDAVDQAGMVQRVGKNNVAGLQHGAEQADIRGVARTEI